MAATEPQSQPGRPRKLPVVPVLLILLLLGLALFGNQGILRLLQADRQKAALEQEVAQLEATNAALRKEIGALRSDRHYVEEIARQELGMVKKGERIYQFPPKKGTKARRSSSRISPEPKP